MKLSDRVEKSIKRIIIQFDNGYWTNDAFEDLRSAIMAELEEQKPKWIPVNERLPEDESRVPILYRYKDIPRLIRFIGEYSPHEERWRNTGLHDIEIVYWLDDVPEPPKGADNEK